MKYGQAMIELIDNNQRLRRAKWGKVFLKSDPIAKPDEFPINTPVIILVDLNTEPPTKSPWSAIQEDMFADDWSILE